MATDEQYVEAITLAIERLHAVGQQVPDDAKELRVTGIVVETLTARRMEITSKMKARSAAEDSVTDPTSKSPNRKKRTR